MAGDSASNVGKILLKMWFAAMLVTCIPVMAKVIAIPLSELVAKSSVIALGHTVKDGQHPPNTVLFEPITVLKGGPEIKRGKVFLACQRKVHADNFDLTELKGDYILFASKEGECYTPFHDMTSTLKIYEKEIVYTWMLLGEPESQPLADFLKKIQALVTNK
jgi:hypothetical protein